MKPPVSASGIGTPSTLSYWDVLQDSWRATRVHGCTCEFCHGLDICTIQKCWNVFYGKTNTNGASSAKLADARAALTGGTAQPVGFNCTKCKVFNEHACSNQADGTYVCFECRT